MVTAVMKALQEVASHSVLLVMFCRAKADFLPVALVLGLVPGVPVEVPIVVVAEDGVTSLRYFLNIMRGRPPIDATAAAAAAPGKFLS